MIYYRFVAIGLALIVKRGEASTNAPTDTNVCPAVMPKNEDACPEGSYFECMYDELCCEGNGNCVPIYQCDCSETAWCNDANIGLACPSICPELPPKEGDACDINPLFLCQYGEGVVCDDPFYSKDYEKICSCIDGVFSCYYAACPEACPDTSTDVVQGDACLPFLMVSCPFGKVCCGDECMEDKNCFCDDKSLTLHCDQTQIPCPLECPATKPDEGAQCDISERFDCYYDSGTCDTIRVDHDITCNCVSGIFTCEQFCPEFSAPSKPRPVSTGPGEVHVERSTDPTAAPTIYDEVAVTADPTAAPTIGQTSSDNRKNKSGGGNDKNHNNTKHSGKRAKKPTKQKKTRTKMHSTRRLGANRNHNGDVP
jgi:hypothetical protein